MPQYPPSVQWSDNVRVADTVEPLYLVWNGTRYEPSTTGPADARWKLVGDRYQPDSATVADEALFFRRNGQNYLRP